MRDRSSQIVSKRNMWSSQTLMRSKGNLRGMIAGDGDCLLVCKDGFLKMWLRAERKVRVCRRGAGLATTSPPPFLLPPKATGVIAWPPRPESVFLCYSLTPTMIMMRLVSNYFYKLRKRSGIYTGILSRALVVPRSFYDLLWGIAAPMAHCHEDLCFD